MNFIYELQTPFAPDYELSYKKCYPLMEAKNQYMFLYGLDVEFLNKIKKIYFIHKKDVDSEFYKEILSCYSPEISKYNDPDMLSNIYELSLLPFAEEIQDIRKRGLVERLIKGQEYISVDNSKEFIVKPPWGKEFIIYLPYKKDLTKDLLKHLDSSNEVHLFSSYDEMKIAGKSGLYEIDTDIYFDVDKKLDSINSENTVKFDPLTYSFNPPSFLQIFNDSLLKELSLVYEKEKKRLQVHGADSLLSNRVINHMLQSYRPIYHDLKRGIPGVTQKKEHTVFNNFELVKEPEEQKKLFDLIDTIDALIYVILQSSRKMTTKYSYKFYDIPLPERKVLEREITKIVIAFLMEKNILRAEGYKLFQMISKNSFLPLLNDFKSLDSLETVIGRFNNITNVDLLTKPEMWAFLIHEMKQLDNLANGLPPIEKNKVIFELVEGDWRISGIGRRIVRDASKNIGIKYLVGIIYHQQMFNKALDVSVLRKEANNLNDGPSKWNSSEQNLEIDRKAISEGLRETKKNSSLNDFIEKYIRKYKYDYWFDSRGEIECEIIHPKLNELFSTPNKK